MSLEIVRLEDLFDDVGSDLLSFQWRIFRLLVDFKQLHWLGYHSQVVLQYLLPTLK